MKYIFFLLCFATINVFAVHLWENTQQNLKNEFFFTCINCLDSINCIAGGYNTKGEYALVYSTSNGGITWSKIMDDTPVGDDTLPIPRNIGDVAITSNNTFYLPYDYGMIKKTTDMGKTFDTVQLYNSEFAYLREIHMLDDNNGITGYFKYVWVTNDGWNTWRRVMNNESHPYFGVTNFWMFSEDYFTYTDNRGFFWRTTDAGKSWNGAYFDKIDSVYPGMSDYCFVNDSIGYMCGYAKRGYGDTSKDIIWKTTNGGISWDLIYNMEYDTTDFQWNWGLQKISFLDELTGVAVGQFGKVLSTTDGGVNWDWELLKLEDGQVVHGAAPAMTVAYAGKHVLVTAFDEGIWRGTQIPTSINTQNRQQNKILTYPNPCNDYLYFQFPHELLGYYTTLQVFDINGNLVAQEEIYIQQGRLKYIHEIQTSGTYFWQVEVGGEIFSGKFIVG